MDAMRRRHYLRDAEPEAHHHDHSLDHEWNKEITNKKFVPRIHRTYWKQVSLGVKKVVEESDTYFEE